MKKLRLRLLLLLSLQMTFYLSRSQPMVIDSLLKIVQENKMDTVEVSALNELAANYARTDFTKSKYCLYQSIELARKLNNSRLLSHSYSQMVTIQLNTGAADSSLYYLNLLKSLSESSGSNNVNSIYNFTAGLYYKHQGNYKAALPYMMESLREFTQRVKEKPTTDNLTTLAGQNLNIGNTYVNLGDYKNALQYHLKALQLFEELNNKKGISFCIEGIGTDFLELDQYKEAKSYTLRALAMKTELSDERGIATSLEQLGTISMQQKQYDSSLNYYIESLKIMQRMKLITDEANLNLLIGQLYTLRKDPANAKIFLDNAKLLAQQIGDSSKVAAADAALIGLQTSMREQQLAETKLLRSLNTSVESGDKTAELQNYQYLSDHYASLKQFDKALEYSKKFYGMNDSLQNADLQMQMKKMEEQYNLDKKEKEIDLLKKDQQLTHLSLQRQKTFQYGAGLFLVLLLLIGFLVINRYRIVQKTRRQLEMEKMRNRIAQDLHDDIGSTISSISVLSNVALQSQAKEDMLMSTNLKKIKERSAAIMESMDDIVWAINPRNDRVEHLIIRMKEFAGEILEPLNINYVFEEDGILSSTSLDIRKRKDLYLIFKEAVNNAAKYSGCNNLLIHLRAKQQSLQMEIMDDGRGFDLHQAKMGNGLNNMKERAVSMGANFQIDSGIGNGTRIRVDLPIT